MFKKFKETPYTLDGMTKKVTQILTAVLPRRLSVDASYVFQRYQVSSGARPESVANELYDQPNYHWTILVVNDIVNPFLDWPLSDEEVELITAKKYTDVYGLHHFYWLSSGKWLDEVDEAIYRAAYPTLPEDVIPVTNLQYEIDVNMKKRSILVVNPRYITQFVEAFNRALEGKE